MSRTRTSAGVLALVALSNSTPASAIPFSPSITMAAFRLRSELSIHARNSSGFAGLELGRGGLQLLPPLRSCGQGRTGFNVGSGLRPPVSSRQFPSATFTPTPDAPPYAHGDPWCVGDLFLARPGGTGYIHGEERTRTRIASVHHAW